jgi:hypothetical protein
MVSPGGINQGTGALNTNYTAALQPYMQNYNTANAGSTALGNVLGLERAGRKRCRADRAAQRRRATNSSSRRWMTRSTRRPPQAA